MKTQTPFSVALLALAAFGGGVLIGRRAVPRRQPASGFNARSDVKLGAEGSGRRGKSLDALPAGKSRNSAIQSCVGSLSHQSMELAAPFVNQIADENQRDSAAQNFACQYMRKDPDAAKKRITGLNLPAEKKERLLEMK